MPTNYIGIGLFIVVGVLFVGATFLVAGFIRPSNPNPVKLEPYESGVPNVSDARDRFHIRYYVLAMLYLVFDLEVVFLYPWAVQYDKLGVFGLFEMLVFVAILLIGYFYAWKKGALDWV
ncbi:MAG TPA: NADH-quinone oxidoreductase subunit A [Chloroflexota bacterium]|nr:NADH-quinone oxidoreductase subunit A [Chloroflexota bacterium]